MVDLANARILVVNDDGILVGILTEADFMRLATRGVPPCTCGGVSVEA